MVNNFKKGPNYTAVHYDEHVMINTVNKNDPDNGKIYRRGYDFNNSLGGAEFVGTIVGPAGRAPMVEMSTISEIKRKSVQQGYEDRFSSGSYKVNGGNLVPGKTGTEEYNDEITWACYSIRNSNGEDSTAYVGFTFPYLVIDYTTESVSPYRNGAYQDNVNVERTDDESHPFYEKWNLKIPRGIKGNCAQNFRVITASSQVEPYTGKPDDINNNRQILVYDYYNYETYENGDPKTLFLGDYNMIDNITINDEGTITIDYSHDNDSVWTKKLKWVKSVTLNTETGLLTIVYNHTTDASGNPTTYTTYLDWIDSVNVADDGTVTFGHTHEADTVFSKKIKWVTGVTINNNGTVTFKWNNGTADTIFNNIIKWISSVNLAADGTLTVGYNNGVADSVFSKVVKWITDVQIANDGTVTVSYNNDDPAYIASQRLKWINDITLTENGTLTVSYNNNSADTIFANRIRWLTNATLANNGTFTLSWNNETADTVYANMFKWISGMTVAADGTVTFTWNNGDSNTVYNNLMKWISGCVVNVGSDEGSGNQKLHITWNDGTEEDIGNPINYIMNMAVNENNHLLIRYSDPVKRAGGITYNGTNGWTDLGQITQQYEYGDGSTATELTWIGIGQLIDYGTDNKRLKFTINPTAFINSAVNIVTVITGTVSGSNGTDTITALNLTTATVTKTLTGLQFEIDSGIASGGAAATDFINLSIEGMGLSFSTASA